MHVLLIHQAFASPGEPGGTRHYELGTHLVSQGHQFSIVTSDRSYLTGKPAPDREAELPGGVRVLRTYTLPTLHRSFVWRVVSFLLFMVTSLGKALGAGRVDVVMGTSPPIFQAVSAWLVAALKRRPFLLEIRDLWPEFAIDMGVLKNPLLIRLSRWLESFLYARATHLLVNSPAYRDYLIGKGIPSGKVSLIPNGVEPGAFDPAAKGEAVRQEWNLDGKFVITYAGALGLANDIPTVIQAAVRLQSLPDIHFLLVGDGKERPRLEILASELGLRNVTFTGARPKSEMPEFLAASDACLAILQDIPMFRTTYPNKVFDYMAAGRPTVLAIDGVIRQVVEAASGGVFVPPGDPEALAEAIRDLAKDQGRAQSMGKAAREYVVRHFDRRRQAEEFICLLERLALFLPRRFYRTIGKRLFDITATFLGLLLLLPVLAASWAVVWASLGAPVLFRQRRPGHWGRPFEILKFRTMTNALDVDGLLLSDAERLTRIGRFLRATSLDEFPELLNVLKGEMSLMGPRPLLMQYLDRYTPEQARRHEVRPGITGWAQVKGRNAISWEEKFKLDVWYVDNQSFWVDMKILAMTVWKSIRREGISQPGEATMGEFMGKSS